MTNIAAQKVGVKNYCIAPGLFKLDGGAMYGIIPKPLWNKVSPADELNRIDLDLRLWLITSQDRIILVDTGIGDYHGEVFDERFSVRQEKNPLELVLNKLNLSLSDITDLVISHLHFDHIGGLSTKTENGHKCLFPNAQIHLHKAHYEYSLKPTQRDSGSFHSHIFKGVIEQLASEKRINWLTGNEGEILKYDNGTKNLNFKCSFGHTPYLVHPYNEQFIYLADLIPTSNHISIPWVMGYDISPGISTENKVEFLNFVMDKDLKIIFEHDPKFWGAKVKLDEKRGYMPSELFNKPNPDDFFHIIEI